MTAIDLPTTATTTHADRSPARGVEHLVLFRIELTRLLRSPRSLAFTLLMPIVFLVVFSITAAGSATFPNGNSAAFVGVGMVLYTGIMAAGSTGATLGVERNRGWTRQLRLTPLTTASFLTVKIATALVRSLVGGAIIVVVELLLGRAVMTPTAWVLTTLIAWLGSAAFTGLGILIGAVFGGDAGMQVLGFALTVLCFLGGVFMPTFLFPAWLQTIAAFTPMWGVHELALVPLTGGPVTWQVLVNTVAWAIVLVAAGAHSVRRSTERV